MKYPLETIKHLLPFCFLLLVSIVSSAQDFPAPMDPPRLVNDYAGLLSDEEFQYLEHKLESYEDSTSNQFAIVIINTTHGYDIGQYSAELGEEWGVGKGGRDNGLLITIAVQDRDMFISTGYGLEGAIPDAASKRIIENYILPNFKNRDYFEGLDEATSLLIGLAEGEFEADEIAADPSDPATEIISMIVTGMFFILPIYYINRRRAKNHYGTTSPSFWMIMALMMSGRGGGRSGSSFNDFSGGGGGFGGFGGGGFGGGGAGGSW